MCKNPRFTRGFFIGMTRLLYIMFLTVAIWAFAQPADTSVLRRHLVALTNTSQARNHTHVRVLDSVASYIYRQMASFADTVFYQMYDVNGRTYRNVVARLNGATQERILLGAHYDVCEEQQGADDNASGVAGLLEAGRLLKGRHLKYTAELVAYTLEEPPFFRTDKMGSYIHAESLQKANTKVLGMISLEMIGYFKNEKNTQD